jgi:hypothetical protein
MGVTSATERGWGAAALVILALLVAPQPSPAQGLGAAASRERQKRQQPGAPVPARVFTDADLAAAKPPQGGEPAAAAAEPGAPAAASGATPDPAGGTAPKGSAADEDADLADPALAALERERQERKRLEAEWRVRFANTRERAALAEAACWREVVRTDFYQGIPVQMKVKEFVETEEYRRAKQALADLEEEFRRTGLPPGWARER